MSLRPFIQDTAATLLNDIGRQRNRGQLRVLMFHGLTDRVHDGLENCQYKHLNVHRFESLVAHLAADYDVLSMDEMVECLQSGAPLPPFPAVLTFDDGFASNYDLAYPILQHYGLPAIIYLATQFVNEKTPIWVDRVDYVMHRTARSRSDLVAFKDRLKTRPHAEILAAVNQLEVETGYQLGRADRADLPTIYRPLNWEQVREMSRGGLISFGSHTHAHVILGRAAPDVIRNELAQSRACIERETGRTCRHFCYPNGAAGDFSEASEQILRESGFCSSITTLGGLNSLPASPFLLRRLGMTNDLRPAQFKQYLALGDASIRGLLQVG
jgi:peptidoglycan/xylan/chitin deacetylase (PgdA/CDA1 family)